MSLTQEQRDWLWSRPAQSLWTAAYRLSLVKTVETFSTAGFISSAGYINACARRGVHRRTVQRWVSLVQGLPIADDEARLFALVDRRGKAGAP